MKESTGDKSRDSGRLLAAVWAFRLIWQTSGPLVSAMIVSTIIRGIVPAGFAITIRGLINTVTDALSQPEIGWDAAVFWLVLSLGITLVDVILVLADKLFSEYLRNDLTLEVNSAVMRHASQVDLPFLENTANRELLERIRRDPGVRLQSLFVHGMTATLSIIQVVSLLAVLAWLEPLIILVAPFVAVPYLLFNWRLARTRYLTEYHRTRDRRWSRYFLSLVTSPSTIGEIKLLSLGDVLAQRFVNTLKAFREQDRKLQFRQFGGGAVFSIITLVAFWALFARLVYRVLEGMGTIGDLAIFAGAVARLRSALQASIKSAAHAYEQTLYIADLREFLETRPVVSDLENAGTRALVGDLAVDKVVFSYPGHDKAVLNGVSFHIKAGEKVALVGENGSGKSTLAKLLVRSYDADTGAILIDGLPIDQYRIAHLQSNISLMGQNFGKYEASMAENIAFGDWGRLADDPEAVRRIATATGLDHIAGQFPEGLETRLGRLFSEHDLSAGQWQLLSIARTLGRDAKVVILDEPTSNIDARAEHALFSAIEKLTTGLTTIIISHRFSTIRMMDRILVMHEGKIIEQGTHDELMAAGGHYRRLYSLHERYRAANSE